MQPPRWQVARITDIVAEAQSLRLDFPRLASIVPLQQEGVLVLGFLNLATECKFTTALSLGELPGLCVVMLNGGDAGLVYEPCLEQHVMYSSYNQQVLR